MTAKICYENEPYPESGWLVICMVTGKYLVVPASNFRSLGNVIGGMQDEADKKYPDRHNPVQCFELGREMAVGVDYAVVRIQPARPPDVKQGTHEPLCAKANDHTKACDCRLAVNYGH